MSCCEERGIRVQVYHAKRREQSLGWIPKIGRLETVEKADEAEKATKIDEGDARIRRRGRRLNC